MNSSELPTIPAWQSRREAIEKSLFDRTALGIFISDSGGRFVDVNRKGCDTVGYSREEMLKLSIWDIISDEERQDDKILAEYPSEETDTLVRRNFVRKDGSRIMVDAHIHLLHDLSVISFVLDEGRQEKVEEEIRHIPGLYATLLQVNRAIIGARDRGTLFGSICDIAVKYGKFDMAAIGELDNVQGTVTLVSFSGPENEKPYTSIDIDKAPYDKGLSAQAVFSGEVITSDRIESDDRTAFWRVEAARWGVRSLAAVPFRLNGKVVGVLTLASKEGEYFGAKERALLNEIGTDISFALDTIELEAERVHAEDALKESEERYRSVYENTQIGLYRASPEGTIQMANPALIRMLGYESLEQLVSRNLSVERFEKDYPREEFIRRIEEEGEVSGLESVWVKADNQAIYIRESARAVRGPDGNTIYYEGTIEDITERKIAEQALRTSEDRFRTLFENAPVSLWEEDLSQVKRRLDDLRNSGVSNIREYLKQHIDVMISLIGASKVLSVNKTTLSLFHAASVLQLMSSSGNSADPESALSNLGTLESIWKGETSYDAETVITTLTGDKRHVILRWKGVPGFEHDYSKILVSMSDITPLRNFEKELENSREMYRELVENINEIIFSLDTDGNLLYASPASERYFGTGYRAKHGTHFSSFIYPEDRPAAAKHFEEQKHGDFTPFECRFAVKGGEVRWGIVHPVPIFTGGKFVGVRGSLLDITERKEAEMRSLHLGEELRALASGLQSAREDERMSISREIHDDLGQGLTTLKLGISLVRRSLLESRSAKTVLPEINELSELSRSVDGLVDSVRRISASLRPEVLDELGLAEAVRWYADQISRQSGIECRVRINPHRFKLDREMSTALFRIFQEALTNVVRHSGAGKAEISLKKRSGKVQLTISDDGSGIDQENIRNKSSIGILGMKERAFGIGGEFTVMRLDPKGTLVKVEVRIEKSGEAKTPNDIRTLS